MTERELLGSGCCSVPVCEARPPTPSLQRQWERFQMKWRRVGQRVGLGVAVLSELNIHTVQPPFKISGMAWILDIRLPKMDF